LGRVGVWGDRFGRFGRAGTAGAAEQIRDPAVERDMAEYHYDLVENTYLARANVNPLIRT